MTNRERIMLAVDVSSLDKVTAIVKDLKDEVGYFKVGLELISSLGAPQIVEHIHKLGGKVFLDGKFCDIPNTVERASRAISNLNVSFFNVHANCSKQSMVQAGSAKGSSKLLAVTVLTSISPDECVTIFGENPNDKVKYFAKSALEAGADGIICSPEELDMLSAPEFSKMLKVTPGVRPSWAEANDQKRTLTPFEAIKKGATHLVIGRPILNPPSSVGTPKQAAKLIQEEIEKALKELKK